MEKQDQDPEYPSSSVALIIGVTGISGLSLAEALKKPTTPGSPWKVYGAARRPRPDWFPTALVDRYITFDALDSADAVLKLSQISHEVTHLFWVPLQVQESEEVNIFSNSTMLKNVLSVLVNSNNGCSCLRHVALLTGTKHYMGPIFDPSLAGQLMSNYEVPFKEDSPRLPFPNFYYALEDIAAAYSPAITYSVHRSSVIIGASPRSLYNSLLTLAVYATICKYQGLPFRYFGNRYTWEHFFDMSDSRLLAEQQIWAATTDKAKNQAFNCTNGDVFTWKSLWKLLSEIFGVEFVPFDDEKNEKFDVVEMMKEKGEVWDEIVEKHGLYKTKLREITCFEALKLVLHFEFQHVSSMNKSREFGFFGFLDTMKSIRMWVGKMREMKIIP